MKNENKNISYLLINVPSFILNPSPYIGIPHLLGILKSYNINCEYVDLNLNYIDYLISDKRINEIIEINKKNKAFKELKKISKETHLYKKIMKKEKYFFNILLSSYCLNQIEKVINISSSEYNNLLNDIAPDIENYRTFCDDEKFSLSIPKLLAFFEDDTNQFKNFYNEKINDIINKNPQIIGISIDNQSQLISGLYLCYLLKKQSNIHINIGGFFFSHFYKIISNLEELFNNFFDSISINNNTYTILELIKYINKETNIENVGNIIHCENKKIRINYSNRKIKFNRFPFQNFRGYNKEDYYISEFVLPIQTSKSCYWRKCIFCSSNDKEYEIKSINNVISEIEYLSKEYNTKYFCFWDNAIHPKYLSKLADKLIEKQISINYSIFARFEKEFNIDLLQKLRKSGCCNINWGLDSADEDILNVINKGINLYDVKKILKESNKAGIFNSVYLILGHPKENIKNIKNDITFIRNNKNFIDILVLSPSVWFVEGSIINKDREYYKSQIITTKEERLKYYNKLMKIKDYDKRNILNLSSNIILYINKKGLYNTRKDLFIYKQIIKIKPLYRLYIMWKFLLLNLS